MQKQNIRESATRSARNCYNYIDVQSFREWELRDLLDAKMDSEANDLNRLATRSALQHLLQDARLEAKCGYETEDERSECTETLERYKTDALKLAGELGLGLEIIAKKFDELKIINRSELYSLSESIK